MPQLKLELLDDTFAIHSLSPSAKIPEAVLENAFFGIIKTDQELCIICRSSLGLDSEYCDRGWICIKVLGPLDLTSTGILAKLSRVLADAQISIFIISTYDTDYILVKKEKTKKAVLALKTAGYQFMEKTL